MKSENRTFERIQTKKYSYPISLSCHGDVILKYSVRFCLLIITMGNKSQYLHVVKFYITVRVTIMYPLGSKKKFILTRLHNFPLISFEIYFDNALNGDQKLKENKFEAERKY